MKSRVLVKAEEAEGGWIATAYHYKGAWCASPGLSKVDALAKLKVELASRLQIDGAEWLKQSYHGGDPESPNCPEGAIKLPIDLWTCKLVDQLCPIQAQVFLGDPEQFFRGCLAPQAKKQDIFEAVKSGKYQGFHHVRSRFLCVLCDSEGKGNFSYHYPWELSALDQYSSYVVERDWPETRTKLRRERRSLSTVINALCADHSKVVAQEIDAVLSSQLEIFEFEIVRP
jgi:hypothetical protein